MTHKLGGRTYFTPDPAHMPVIPKQIAGYVLAVTGLESYSVAPHTRGVLPPTGALPQARPTRAGRCLRFPQRAATSQKIAAAYGYNRLWSQGWHGENTTVNLVEMDGYDESDVANYLTCTGSHIQLGNVNLGATAPPVGGEATLDIQMLAGLAPSARVVDYQEDPALLNTGSGTDSWTAFNNALQRVIDDNYAGPHPGSVVSLSLGGSEGMMSQATMQAVDQNIRILSQAEHMTVFVATGDCGAYGDRVYGPLDVSFPSTSTWAVAVGGTSAAAPIWAAGMALVNQGLLAQKHYFCYGPDTLYHAMAAGAANRPFYDVTTGNNLYYPAPPGYDLSTGLGTPNAPGILTTLATSPQ